MRTFGKTFRSILYYSSKLIIYIQWSAMDICHTVHTISSLSYEAFYLSETESLFLVGYVLRKGQ